MALLVVAAGAALAGTTLAAAEAPDVALLHWLSSAGAIGILAFVLLSLMRGWLVTGRTFDRVLNERNRLLELALTSANAANRAVEIAHEDRDRVRRIAGTAEADL